MENYQIWGENMHFQPQVYEQASTDLFNMGINVSLLSTISVFHFVTICPNPQIISYTLREIKDEESYMESMGQSRTSEVRRDARIGEAECNRQEHSFMFWKSKWNKNVLEVE